MSPSKPGPWGFQVHAVPMTPHGHRTQPKASLGTASPWEWSCDHHPPLIPGLELPQGLYASHSVDYFSFQPCWPVRPQYGHFQFVPHSHPGRQVVQELIINPVFLMRKSRLREGMGWPRATQPVIGSAEAETHLNSFYLLIFPMEVNFSDYIRVTSYL